MSSIRERGTTRQTDPSIVLSHLSPIQTRFVHDPHRYKIARCGRRAGKSDGIVAYLTYKALLNRNTPLLYAGLTRDSARETIWPLFEALFDRYKIRHHYSASKLQIDFPNGSKITIFGCDAENARNRLRGRRFDLACFDETGFYAALDPLIYAILPMLADYSGTLCLTSSPGELLSGFFYEADQGLQKESWSRYHWTIHDNPHFQKPATDPKYKTRAEEELAQVLAMQFKNNAMHPSYRREFLGEWVSDNTSLVYPLLPFNLIDRPVPMPQQEHAVGIFLGSFSYTLVVGRYSHHSRQFHFIESKTFEDISLDQFMAYLDSACRAYQPSTMTAISTVYTPKVIEALKRRYKIGIHIIKDDDRSFYQKIFESDLAESHIRIVKSLPLASEFAKIVKNSEGNEVAGQSNFLSLAALALYRKVHTTTLSAYEPPKSDEQRHIEQLENSRFALDEPWYG